MLANKMEVNRLYFSSIILVTMPMPMGMMNASKPSMMALPRFFLKSDMFISRPARNMM